jgi:hypothetical protein
MVVSEALAFDMYGTTEVLPCLPQSCMPPILIHISEGS